METERNKGSRLGATAMQKQDMVEGEGQTATVKTKMVKKGNKEEPILKAEDGDSVVPVAFGYEEYFPLFNGAVDEQMSWGSVWLPLLDLNSLGEDYDALYSDGVWVEDIWNLKAIKEVPRHDQKFLS